jgi:putative ABC transport system permease protein
MLRAVTATMRTVVSDARLGWRGLRRHPGWAAVAVATLAIGIGASSATFSVVYATYLAPLPYRGPERLVVLWSQHEGQRNLTAAADFLDWQQRSRSLEGMVAFGWKQVALATAERPEEVQAGPTTPGLFSVLGYGQPMALGRPFTPEECRVGHDAVAVLSHRLWQQHFGGDPDIVSYAPSSH